jgi:hypothetical protein
MNQRVRTDGTWHFACHKPSSGREEAGESSDPLDLTLELSVLPGSKPHVAVREFQRPNDLLTTGSEQLSLCSNPQMMRLTPCHKK